MTEEQNKYEEINVANEWVKDILDSIRMLKELERVCKDGPVDIADYYNIPKKDIPLLQMKYFRQMFTEINILLRSSKPILNKEDYDNFISKINSVRVLLDFGEDNLLDTFWDQRTNNHSYSVTRTYNINVNKMCKIYGDIIEKLADEGIIFPKVRSRKDERRMR